MTMPDPDEPLQIRPEDLPPGVAEALLDVAALTRCPDCNATPYGVYLEVGVCVVRMRHGVGCPWLERASAGVGVVMVVHNRDG